MIICLEAQPILDLYKDQLLVGSWRTNSANGYHLPAESTNAYAGGSKWVCWDKQQQAK
jgi:hypothetical protein